MSRKFHFVACAIVLAAVCAALPGALASLTGSDLEQIVASEHAWVDAAVKRNAAGMAGLMSDDYVEIAMETAPGASKSRWMNTGKAEWIDLVRSGREKYTSVELSNLKVYLHGDVATVTGEYSQAGTKDGKDISAAGSYVNTWVKKNGNWQVVSSVFP
jgi:ketosteroid isomerase-like protein